MHDCSSMRCDDHSLHSNILVNDVGGDAIVLDTDFGWLRPSYEAEIGCGFDINILGHLTCFMIERVACAPQ